MEEGAAYCHCHLRKCYDSTRIRTQISFRVERDAKNMVISLLKANKIKERKEKKEKGENY